MTVELKAATPTAFSPPSAGPVEPYVGLRPYREHERPLFFGRDQDAQRLRNKIFAGPLTILYAPSGVGKTSLLITLVIPDLRAQDSLVVYCDCAPESEPSAVIKAAIRSELARTGVQLVLDDNAALPAVACAAVEQSSKPLVIVLDQFERFLIQHAAHPDPLREEIASLVRTECGVHIVIALRQEFLAALDVFRERILTLFRSTFHLVHLEADGARAAITRPAELFDGSCEPALVDALCHDLRTDQSGGADPAVIHGGGIELPFLQIVCRRLWQAAADHDRRMTYESYQRLGRSDGVIRNYIDGVVSSLPVRQRADMARVLDFLAPRSGTKMSFAIQDLRERTRLPETRVRAALKRLYDHWVVRERRGGGAQAYELYHDAFIKILRPWVDNELWRIRRRTWVRRGVVVGVVAQALVVAAVAAARWYADQERTTWRVQRLQQEVRDAAVSGSDWASKRDYVARALDDVAWRLIATERDADLARLEAMLREGRAVVLDYYARRHEPRIVATSQGEVASSVPSILPRSQRTPGGGGTGGSARGAAPLAERSVAGSRSGGAPAGATSPAVLRLRYAEDPDLGGDFVERLRAEWTAIVLHLARAHGIPLPATLDVASDADVPPGSLRVIGSGQTDSVIASLSTHWGRELTIIREDSLSNRRVRNFFFSGQREGWDRADPRLPGGPWWIVPRWTLPIWRVSRQADQPPARLVAMALGAKVLQQPELIITDDAVSFLLRKEHEFAPRVVDEILIMPGGTGRVRDALIEIVRKRRSIGSLSSLLDLLVDRPKASAQVIAAAVDAQAESRGDALPSRATGRLTPPSADRLRKSPAYRALEVEFPRREPHLRVYLGDAIAKLVMFPTAIVRPALSDSLFELSGEFFRRYGFTAPAIWFDKGNGPYDDVVLPPASYRVELLAQTLGDRETQAVHIVAADAIPTIVADLRDRLMRLGPGWLTADQVDTVVGQMPSGQQRWLRTRLSAGDLKRLLRSALAPPVQAGESGKHLDQAGTSRAAVGAALSIESLFASLVFWAVAGDLSDLSRTAAQLRETRHAMSAPPPMPSDLAVSRVVERGILALERDQVELASKHFRSIADHDRTEATTAFLSLYARRTSPRQLATLESDCVAATGDDPSSPRVLSDKTLFALEDALRPTPATTADTRARLQSCLFSGYVAREYHSRAGDTFDELMTTRAAENWSAPDAYRLAYRALMSPDVATHPGRLSRSQALIVSAIGRWTDVREDSLAMGLTRLCTTSHDSPPWCRAMVDSVTALRPASVFLPLFFGIERSAVERKDEAREALGLIDRADSRLRAATWATDDVRAQFNSWIGWVRGRGNLTLAQYGDRKRLPVAAKQIDSVLSSLESRDRPGWPGHGMLFGSLINVHLLDGRFDRVESVLRRAAPHVDAGYARGMRHLLHLARGQADSAALVADKGLLEEPYDEWAMFRAASSQLLVGTPNADSTARRFLRETKHDYRDYVRLILFWRLAGTPASRSASEGLLLERWADVDTTTWNDRLKARDGGVWREMLLGYYLGRLDRNRIFGSLVDEQTFERSELSSLPFPLEGIRCEAHFYDALLQAVTGSVSDRRARTMHALDRSLATRYYPYYEYHWARMLREHLASSP